MVAYNQELLRLVGWQWRETLVGKESAKGWLVTQEVLLNRRVPGGNTRQVERSGKKWEARMGPVP